jgi:hypothetical protein
MSLVETILFYFSNDLHIKGQLRNNEYLFVNSEQDLSGDESKSETI